MHRLRTLGILAAAAALAATAVQAQKSLKGNWNLAAIPAEVKPALDAFNADAIRAHDWFLSSDQLEGRGPGTRGGQIAMNYIAAQFEALGLQPDGDNGTYFQKVSLIGLELDPSSTSLAFTKNGAPAIGPLAYKDQFVGGDETQATTNTLDSDVVFVGHGVVAPEYKWDDYKGLDTKGKTLVMLVDDPPATTAEPDLFKGKARTYYGRWTYKYEMGAAKNAAAVILIHTDQAAGYGWQVVRNSWGGERSYLRAKPGESKLKFAGWVTKEIAQKLFQNAGLDLDKMTQAASSRDFKPVPLNVKFSGNIGSKVRPFDTANVVAKLAGSDAKLKDQAVLYTAHHDHLGIGTPDETGDTIYNGAIDNASGCAVLLEMARVWTKSPRPKRTLIFAAVAAEEQGLLGSAYYGENPTVPAGRIALNINFDSIFELGEVSDVTMNGVERTTFYPTAQKVTKALGLTIVPDQAPEQGHYYRSDHFSLGKVGVPAFSVDQGHDIVGQPPGWGEKMLDEYRDKHYHQPSDEFDPKWDWKPAVQMGQLGYWLGWEAANAPDMPNWKPGDEFRAARDKSLK